MKPKFISEKAKYTKLYNTLSELRSLSLDEEKLRAEGYLTDVPVDDINWSHIYSIIAYLRLNKRNSNAGWHIYFQLYDDDKVNLKHFLDTYKTSPFNDCSYVYDASEFLEINVAQKEKFGNQWSILGAEDHIVFANDLSWFLVTDCATDISTIHYKPESRDIIDIWKREFLFEIQNSDL